MDLLLARVIEGVNNGAIYGFLALALVCVYRGTSHLNLAQGEMAMFCGFLAFSLNQAGLPVVAAIAVTVLAGALGGVLVERTLIRPLGEHAEYSVLLIAVALFLILNAGAGTIWGGDPLPFPSVLPSDPEDYLPVFGARLRYQPLLLLAALLTVLGLLYALFRFTKIGLAMRTAASNPEAARLLGIRVSRINALGWMLAAGIGALVAPLVAPSTTLTTSMMFNFLIYACAAAILGGLDSPGGAVLAGLSIGVVENLLAGYVPWVGSDLKQGVALVVLLVVLMVRPAGLFGTKRVERV